MKRCPSCGRVYDVSMRFCVDDGSDLLYGAAPVDQGATVPMFVDPSTPEDKTLVLSAASVGSAPGNTVAVLPFANMSPDEDAEYLSDGLAEELLNVLSRIQGLRVTGRTSSFFFKGKQSTFAEIGRQLNVSSVLEGSVRKANNRVRIAVQLVNAADGYRVWSQTYDRTLDDIFAIQDEIAGRVVDEIRSRLVGEEAGTDIDSGLVAEVANAVRGRSQDPEAHRLMLLGRHLSERRSKDDLTSAVEYFTKALEIDPQNAQCWIELGNTEFIRASHGFIDTKEGFSTTKAAISRALSLDAELASAHALLARVLHSGDRDLTGAHNSVKRALAIDPEDPFVLISAATITRYLGLFNVAGGLYQRAIDTDPLNSAAHIGLGLSLYGLGQLAEAEMAVRRSLELTPQAIYKHAFYAELLLAQGRVEEAHATALKETADIWQNWALALIAGTRERSEVASYINKLDPLDSAFQIAEIYASMNEIDQAFEMLDVALEHDPGIITILSSVQLRSIHGDPRWERLLLKIGIPTEYWPMRDRSDMTHWPDVRSGDSQKNEDALSRLRDVS